MTVSNQPFYDPGRLRIHAAIVEIVMKTAGLNCVIDLARTAFAEAMGARPTRNRSTRKRSSDLVGRFGIGNSAAQRRS